MVESTPEWWFGLLLWKWIPLLWAWISTSKAKWSLIYNYYNYYHSYTFLYIFHPCVCMCLIETTVKLHALTWQQFWWFFFSSVEITAISLASRWVDVNWFYINERNSLCNGQPSWPLKDRSHRFVVNVKTGVWLCICSTTESNTRVVPCGRKV